jgi:acyl transferase domain-containing protein/NADPH:quinone reductase-like Zn-dependent oxidoreductase/acyl carrier protein/SAM-dependent methyltransferase/GNAT superfamily N-acetyltransferase
MLDLINRYAHGFVAIPTILACRQRGFFELLAQHGPLSGEQIAECLQANAGHLSVALRLMHSLGWLAQDANGAYTLTAKAALAQEVPAEIVDLLQLPVDSYLTGQGTALTLRTWVERSQARWGVSDPLLADFLDGVLLIPLLLVLHKHHLLDEHQPQLHLVNDTARTELSDLFVGKGWAKQQADSLRFTDVGQFIARRALIWGTTASYAPMLVQIDELLFGDSRTVFARDLVGNESHLDRTLNVVSSGFQHGKFFADVDEMILTIFNRQPISEQPNYVADMGCGNGAFLARVYQVIRDKSARRKVLDQHPVTMIGVDYNTKALVATAQTLADIPHLVFQGDIGDPERLVSDFKARGINPDEVLHIRSFLDHDRTFIPPADESTIENRAHLPYQGIYVNAAGGLIPPHVMVQSLVEHLRRWAKVVGKYGLILLEVHCLPPALITQFLDQSENLHFDAYHSFSQQYLVEADVFLMAAAEVGLFPKPGFYQRYPRTLPFSRITLNWFEKHPYTVRHTRIEDMPALLRLEAACWAEPLRVSKAQIRQCIERFPQGQVVLEINGEIVGAIYSQPIERAESLANITYDQIPSLHSAQGNTIQLLGINILPEMQGRGLGDQLLEFVLEWFTLKGDVQRVVGITRCKNYVHALQPMSKYIQQRDEQGRWVDPILRFHTTHGATIRGIVYDYRPADVDNQGHGILIEYDLLDRQRLQVGQQGAPISTSSGEPSLADTIATAVCTVLGTRRQAAYAANRPLMEMGLDSLDLLALRANLSHALNEQLDPTFFFRYGTPEAITRYFQAKRDASMTRIDHPNRSVVNPSPVSAGHNKLTPERQRLPSTHGYSPAQHKGTERVNCPPMKHVDNAIAIVGMACRFPGGVNNPEQLWTLLRTGVDAITEIPSTRWDVERYHGQQPGQINSRYGGFLDNVDQFDAAFFHIAPVEAKTLDPQQRLLLETGWEALERAGVNPTKLTGTDTGVFVGIFSHDYELLQAKQHDTPSPYFATGNSASMAAARLAYFFGLQGPAMAVDTACSSSLVAVHLASQSLRNGECYLALAAGVNLILSPDLSMTFSCAGMLAPDGRCKTFDAAANGYVRSEGCGVVVLKRLADALSDGDNVLTVIRGNAINQDGASNGLTVPNGLAQEALLRKALAAGGMTPGEISYVEAHGTGTSLGDPIEMKALETIYGPGRTQDNPLIVGSVKTNIGHTEAVSGIAGLMKVVLSLQHGYIPPHLHFKQLNPHLGSTQFVIPTQGMAWARHADQPRRAGISSFGFSGTNAHVIVEEAPQGDKVTGEEDRSYHLLALSAKSEKALHELAGRYQAFFNERLDVDLGDICYTANSGRSHFAYRLSIVGQSIEEMQRQLATLANGEASSSISQGYAPEYQTQPKIAFLFTGQGSQYVDMGRELYETQPAFRQALECCDEILCGYLGESLLEVMYPGLKRRGKEKTEGQGERRPVVESEIQNPRSKIDETAYTQPALFGLEYALAELWKSWGIEPDMVMGHSVGEYVAACVAGVFSLEDGLKLIASRGRLMQALPQDGTMVAVMAEESHIMPLISPYVNDVSIAAVNGPQSVVISGRREAVRTVAAQLTVTGVKTQELTVSHAFHSPLMQPMLAEFEQLARTVQYAQPRIALVSNLTGKIAQQEVMTPTYWVKHVREAVRFADGMQCLQQQGIEVFLEIGPKPTLLGMGLRCLPEDKGLWLPSLRPQREWPQLLESLAALYVRGVRLDWVGFDRDYAQRKVVLPTYPFQRSRYWTEAPGQGQPLARGPVLHPLLGERINTAALTLFQGKLDTRQPAYLGDYRVYEHAVLPAAAYLEMALAAGAQVLGSERLRVEDVVIYRALHLPEAGSRTVQCTLTPEGAGQLWRIYSSEADLKEPVWVLHAEGRLLTGEAVPERVELARLQAELSEQLEVATYYERLRRQGLDYGPEFQAIEALWRGPGRALGRLGLPPGLSTEASAYQLHPVLLDGALQVLGAALGEVQGVYLPLGLERFRLLGTAGLAPWSEVRLRSASQETAVADLRLLDSEGRVLALIEGLRLKRAERGALLGDAPWREWLYEPAWRAQIRFFLAPDYLPAPGVLAQELGPRVLDPALEGYAELVRRLDVLAVAYVLRALRQLGLAFEPQARFSTPGLAKQLGIVARYERLLGRLLAMLAEAGVLRPVDLQWEVITRPELEPEVVGDAIEMVLLRRCGSRLAEVLQGECDPLSLLFPEGDVETAASLYRDAPEAQVLNTLVQRTLSEVLARLSTTGGIRVLEIGAGTGGTTSYLLPDLPAERTEYVFTDVTAAFTTRAQHQFAAYPFIDYRLLDIEQAPETQGFTAHHYHVVVAANVLHATVDLRQTLRHVRSLLAPGGLLVLIEVTTPSAWIDLTFGLTEGWWRFADTELRPDCPLLAAERWRALLREMGFTEPVALTPPGAQQTLILAQAAQETEARTRPWLILADGQGVGERLAEGLAARGDNPIRVLPGAGYERLDECTFRLNPGSPADYRALLEALPGLSGVVQCWPLDAAPTPSLEASDAASCASTLYLVQALTALTKPPALWLATRGAVACPDPCSPSAYPPVPGLNQAPLWGLGQVIALEHPELGCVRVDLDPQAELEEVAEALLEELVASDQREDQIAYRGGVRHVARLVRQAKPASDRPLRLEISERGTLEGLALKPMERCRPEPGEVEIRVQATGLNFIDVLDALGLLPYERAGGLGGECAGEVVAVGEGVEWLKAGDRAVALAAGSFSAYVTTRAELAAVYPDQLSPVEAVTVPIAFLTAYYALHQVARIQAGDRVLIHAAAGGTGMAAVQLAQQAGAEVYATASPGKWEALRALGVEHLYSSRTLAFGEAILRDTGGAGVDMVLNSLTGEGFIEHSLAVLGQGGRFVEIARRDVWTPEQVAAVRPDVRYCLLDMRERVQQDPAAVSALLGEVLGRFASGQLKPLPCRVFPLEQAVEAFRCMQQARHLGKIVVVPPGEVSQAGPVALRADGRYLITGGLGGLGLRVARWLVERGARQLALIGRRPPDEAARSQLMELEERGVEVIVAQADVANREQLAGVLARLDARYPLRGVIHAAGALDDGGLKGQSWERFARVLAPKVLGAWHLHTLTQDSPLDFFVLFSSVAALLGSMGQGNHAAANAFLDALAHYRRAHGLPGLAINWGAWSEIGAAAKRLGQMRLKGMGVIAPEQGLEILEQLLGQASAQVGVAPIDWSQFGADSPFLGEFRSAALPKQRRPSANFVDELAAAPVAERQALLTAHVQAQLTQVLGHGDKEAVPLARDFAELGIDSLTSLELRNRLQNTLGCKLPSTLAFDYPTVEALVDHLVQDLTLSSVVLSEFPSSDISEDMEEIVL